MLVFKHCCPGNKEKEHTLFLQNAIVDLVEENDSLKAALESNTDIYRRTIATPMLTKPQRDSLFSIWEKETGLWRHRVPRQPVADEDSTEYGPVALTDCRDSVETLQILYEKTILIARRLQKKATDQGSIIRNQDSVYLLQNQQMLQQQQSIDSLRHSAGTLAKKIKHKNKTLAKLAAVSLLEALGILFLLKL